MPDLAAYNALPFFNAAAAALTLLGGIWMMVKGKTDVSKVPPPADLPQGLQIFMNGPLVQALNCLRETNQGIDRTNQSLRDFVHGQNNVAQILTGIGENQRRVRDELDEQTKVHIDLMRKIQAQLDDVIRKQRNGRRE